MKEQERKQEECQKQNKRVEFAKEICNENKKTEKQNKEKQC